MRHTLVPPPGFKVQLPLPADETLQLGPVKYVARYTQERDGSVVARFWMDSGKRSFTPREVEAFRKAHAALLERGMPEVRFRSEAVRLREDGRSREALALYRQRIEDAPKSAIAHARYAGALMELGFGDAAREEAKRATIIGSDVVVTWLSLGWVRSRDLFGRPFQKGYERSGAIEALKRAVELSPADWDIRMRLARLYERNEAGELYGKGADLPRAITEYAHAVDALKSTEAEVPLLSALFAAGRHDEVIARAPKLAETPERNAVWLSSLALKRGELAAIAEANRRIRDLGQRRQAMVAASQQLSGLRRYQPAAALMREGIKGSADTMQLERLSLLEKLRPLDEVKLSPSDPRAAIVSLMRAVVEGKWNSPDLYAARVGEELQSDRTGRAFAASLRGVPEGAAGSPRCDGLCDESGPRRRREGWLPGAGAQPARARIHGLLRPRREGEGEVPGCR